MLTHDESEFEAVSLDSHLGLRLDGVVQALSESSRRCLRSQACWLRGVASLADSDRNADLDYSPAANSLKCLEIELRQRVLTPDFLDAVGEDLDDGLFPPETGRALWKYLTRTEDRCCLGQAAGILRGLALCRREAPAALHRTRTGRSLRRLSAGLRLLDADFLTDLDQAVTYRNRAAHGPLSASEAAFCNQLLLGAGGPGEEGEGLLGLLLRASVLRH